jgi:hypothetical protein
VTRFDWLALITALAVAALLRLPGIDARGTFDADQGHDMLTLAAFTRDGVVPLLGPKTSVGEFHHGAFYYFLLAPAAAISNADPVAVTAFIALLGIAAVALTWWLARAIGGPVAGALAGVLLAVSPAAIDESTFLWNPNPIGMFAVLALAAAWRGHHAPPGTRSRAWWVLALGAAGAVTQLHVLGVVFLVAIVVLCLLELRRDRGAVLGLLGGLGVIAVLFAPLLVHELQTGFLETRRVLDYLRAADQVSAGGPVATLAFTLLRIVAWPLIGLVTDIPALSAIVLAVTVGLAAIGLLRARGVEATGLRWLVGLLAWSTIALSFAAPSLQRVVPGLPNDHYHAFVDPIVVILIAVAAAGLISSALERWRSTRQPGPALGGATVAGIVGALVVIGLARMPPLADPNGGWPKLRDAGVRIVAGTRGAPVAVIGLPDFKLPDAVAFPIVYAGGNVIAEARMASWVVVACDRLFEAAVGARCGGPAEDGAILVQFGSRPGFTPSLVYRFEANPRTSISVYKP